MKKLILLSLMVLGGLAASAQVVYYYGNPYPWLGPKHFNLSVGKFFPSGMPSFRLGEYDYIQPQAFEQTDGIVLSGGFEMITANEGFIHGPYLLFDYYKNGWEATFDGAQTYGSQYNKYEYHYRMNSTMAVADFGLMLGYGFNDRFVITAGGGVDFRFQLNTQYDNEIFRISDGASVGPETFQALVNEDHSAPKTAIGWNLKLEANYYLTDWFFVGAQLRYHGAPFLSDADDYMIDGDQIGALLYTANDGLTRTTALLTLGFQWD